ncbi:MAG: S1 family peptidase [Chloroflexota bacterium]
MDIRQSILGIVARSGSEHKFAGTGFVVSGGLILTCAHVVDGARQTDDRVQFRVEGRPQFFEAEIAFTSPVIELDICVLEPVALPADVPALALMHSGESKGHAFSVFGYPQQGGFLGLNGAGTMLGPARDGQGREVLQLASNQVTHGFSGGPVWDVELEAVVGMVSRGFEFDLDKKLGDVAFAIPSEVLAAAYPSLAIAPVRRRPQPTAGPSISIGGNVSGAIVIGNNNVVGGAVPPQTKDEE